MLQAVEIDERHRERWREKEGYFWGMQCFLASAEIPSDPIRFSACSAQKSSSDAAATVPGLPPFLVHKCVTCETDPVPFSLQ